MYIYIFFIENLLFLVFCCCFFYIYIISNVKEFISSETKIYLSDSYKTKTHFLNVFEPSIHFLYLNHVFHK